MNLIEVFPLYSPYTPKGVEGPGPDGAWGERPAPPGASRPKVCGADFRSLAPYGEASTAF